MFNLNTSAEEFGVCFIFLFFWGGGIQIRAEVQILLEKLISRINFSVMWPEICYWHCKCHHDLFHVSVAQCLTWKPHLCAVDWCDFLRAVLLLAKCELTRKNHINLVSLASVTNNWNPRSILLLLFLFTSVSAGSHAAPSCDATAVCAALFVRIKSLNGNAALAWTLEAGVARETPQRTESPLLTLRATTPLC